ncbi:MAG: phosphatase domain-containing protein, partial [Synechococcales bacterium]|nr:phosphatase domain-containing protein [Synechococcales bacterium]
MNEEWIRAFSDFTGTINDWIDNVRGYLAAALGIEDPIKILPYRGYGSPGSITVKGRVLKDEGVKLREENAPLWENLWNMFKRFATDEVEGARIQAELGDVSQEAVTDKEGFFEAELRWSPGPDSTHLWFPVKLNLLHPDKGDMEEDPVINQSEVMVVRETASFGVISDIDDTIVHTAATDLLKMIQIAYLGNARSRRPFPGVAEFYRALQGGKSTADNNPIFYVSSSAWNMYDVFEAFMDLNHIPKGPILLRDAELALDNLLLFEHETHKLQMIQPIFERFPNLPFLLIGDSGQKDAEIYRQLAKQYPGRIWAILIRDVLPNDAERQQQLASIQADVEA